MVFSIAIIGAIIAALTLAPMSITGQKTAQTFTTHSGAIITTTGQILDPLYTESTLEFDPMEFLRNFEYGKVTHLEDGTVLREFTIIADDSHIMEISPGVFYNVWAFNGTVPGPTIRATEGDLVRIHFINNGSKPHTMHFHGIHAAEFDGVFEPVGPGGQFIYEWTAEPVGVHPYHCHVMPLEEHIAHGLYGVYIVDPKESRAPADEMVMVLNGFDTDFDTENNLYAANTVPFYYQHHPIQIDTEELVRIYVVNMVEFDAIMRISTCTVNFNTITIQLVWILFRQFAQNNSDQTLQTERGISLSTTILVTMYSMHTRRNFLQYDSFGSMIP